MFKKHFATPRVMLSLKINEEKNVHDTLLEFLGIEIDSLEAEARLPKDKLLRAKTCVKQTLLKKRTELRLLLGFLIVRGQRKVYYLSIDMRADLV